MMPGAGKRFLVVAVVSALGLIAGDARMRADAAAAKKYDKAISLYTRAIESGTLTTEQMSVTVAGRAFAYYFKRQYEPALVDFDEAIRLAPDVPEFYAGRGAVYFDMGRHGEALDDYEEAVRLKPGYTKAIRARDATREMLAKGGGKKTARPKQRRADDPSAEPSPPEDRAAGRDPAAKRVASASPAKPPPQDEDQPEGDPPDGPTAAFERGLAHLSGGQFGEAIDELDRVIAADPRFAAAYRARSQALTAVRQRDRAIADAERAFALEPDAADARRVMALALNGKAWHLATSSDAAERDGRRAVDLAATAVRLEAEEPYLHGTLAAAYAEAGRFAEAVAAQRRAAELLVVAERTREAVVFLTRLEAYRQNKPHRR